MLKNNRNMINNYLRLYNLYKDGDITLKDYKNIVKNTENI
jgi:hypothetical protein